MSSRCYHRTHTSLTFIFAAVRAECVVRDIRWAAASTRRHVVDVLDYQRKAAAHMTKTAWHRFVSWWQQQGERAIATHNHFNGTLQNTVYFWTGQHCAICQQTASGIAHLNICI